MASRSAPARFYGNACPEKLSFGKVHGPSPAVGMIEMEGEIPVQLGQPAMIQIGNTPYYGFVTKTEYKKTADSPCMTSARLVDWRDRLHDLLIFAAFNMEDEDGRWWHILPEEWIFQRKTLVAKAFGQHAFDEVQRKPPALMRNFANAELMSPATLMDMLATLGDFDWRAEDRVMQIMKTTRVINLDWNAGVTFADAIENLLSQIRLQWSAIGVREIVVTLRGFTDNLMLRHFVDNAGDICGLGAADGSIGTELNEAGRRVFVVGDPNRYENTYLCRQNWNPAWDFQFCFDGWTRSAVLKDLQLTELSKVKELPAVYHDEETWTDFNPLGKGKVPSRQTRNEMTIRDYLEKIAWKAYVVDFRHTLVDLVQVDAKGPRGNVADIDNESQTFGPNLLAVRQFDPSLDWDAVETNSAWPLSRSLVTDSNRQSVVYATSNRIVEGIENPFSLQAAFVPMGDGFSMEIEEAITTPPMVVPPGGVAGIGQLVPGKGPTRTEYRVRLFFNAPQVWLENIDGAKDAAGNVVALDEPAVEDAKIGKLRVLPDWVAITLSLDREFYTHMAGEAGQGPRVRTKKISVRNLYQGFVEGVEQVTLKQNFMRDLAAGGQQIDARPVKADDMAKHIAEQHLFHQAVTIAGGLHFEDRCGWNPDGIIDSVQVSYDPSSGIEEFVNFTSGPQEDQYINGPSIINVSTVRKNEDEIIRDRLIDIGKAIQKQPAAAKRVMGHVERAMHIVGAMFAPAEAAKKFGQGGQVKAKVNGEDLKNIKKLPAKGVVIAADPEKVIELLNEEIPDAEDATDEEIREAAKAVKEFMDGL